MSFKLTPIQPTDDCSTCGQDLKLTLGIPPLDPTPASLEFQFNAEDCGCKGGGGSGQNGSIVWTDIGGIPACITDCAKLYETIKAQGLVKGINDTPTVALTLDSEGVLTASLVSLDPGQVLGAKNKALRVQLDDYGRVVGMTEYDIEITSGQVTYTHPSVPEVTTVETALNHLFVSGADKYYVHQQLNPSSVWVCNHGMGKVPSFVVKDQNGRTLTGVDWTSLTPNTINLIFGDPYAGTAYFN